MKRGLAAIAVVLLACATPADADYLRVKVDLKHITPYPASSKTQAPAAPGVGVGVPGIGFPAAGGGKKGFPVRPGNQPNDPSAKMDSPSDHMWVTVYLHIQSEPKQKAMVGAGIKIIQLDHQYGKNTFLPIPPKDDNFLEAEHIQRPSLTLEHDKKLNRLKESPKAKDFVDLAFWDWSHGLMKQFHQTLEELKKVDAKHPAAVAYQKIQKQLAAAAPGDDPSLKDFYKEMRSQNYRSMVSDKGRYVLFTTLTPGKDDAKVKRRLTRLEEALESFYYWFALQDNVPVPPMPRHRLAGVLISEPAEFYRKHKSWGPVPMLGSGFTPRRDNVMVLCVKRLDDAYVLMENWMEQWKQQRKLETTELLDGKVWNRSDAKPNALAFSIIQTMAVVEKAMEDEAERATLTHEAVRQLLAATGLLPHNVAAPEWIQEGLASYFERPFGAVYGAGGLPSWSNLVAYKHYKPSLGKGRDMLLNTITDRYFHIARQASMDLEEGRERPDRVQADWERAQATSWALVYYLDRQQNMDRLLGYITVLAHMPRDMELSDRALEATFAKTFGLTDAKGPMKLDPGRLQSFADKWVDYMKGVSLEVPSEEMESLKTRKMNSAPPAKKSEPTTKGPATLPAPPGN
jgi:hypothetical protein